jgi:HD-GYP domain-containing protein (c-di-GMP phosphodiesterase class II)
VAAAVWASHEWFGGGGYPHQLHGSAIPLASRLIAVADAYDSMTECRPYRMGLDPADAVSELLCHAPSQFDPDVVVAFLKVIGNP